MARLVERHDHHTSGVQNVVDSVSAVRRRFGFGYGYDPSLADVKGRFWYLQLTKRIPVAAVLDTIAAQRRRFLPGSTGRRPVVRGSLPRTDLDVRRLCIARCDFG